MIGTLIGAPVGAAIGSANGEPEAGALVGGVLGAFTGNRLGASVDAQNQRDYYQGQARRNTSGLTIGDLISMTRNGLGEDVILTQIANQGLSAVATTEDLITLKNSGVSDRVIQAVQHAAPAQQHQQQPVIVEEHYWGPTIHPYRHPYGPRRIPYRPPPRRVRRGSAITFSHRF